MLAAAVVVVVLVAVAVAVVIVVFGFFLLSLSEVSRSVVCAVGVRAWCSGGGMVCHYCSCS